MDNISKMKTPQEDQAEAKLSVRKPEIVEDKTLKRPSPKGKNEKVCTEIIYKHNKYFKYRFHDIERIETRLRKFNY